MASAAPPLLDSQTYYFRVGRGRWRGAFAFRITDRGAFRAARLRLKERLLARGMALAHRLTGDSRIDSDVWARPEDGVAGMAGNTVRISRFGITLYLLRETYTLAANGSDVAVHAHERFGPIPFLLRNEKRHPAAIHADGMSSTYYIPLLGADWIATYTVHPDRTHIDGVLSARGHERRRRFTNSPTDRPRIHPPKVTLARQRAELRSARRADPRVRG